MTNYMFNYNGNINPDYPCVHDCTGCGRPMIYRKKHANRTLVFRVMCDACLSTIAHDEVLRDGLPAKARDCSRCCSDNYAMWWLGEFEASVCIHSDIELMERLLKLCDPANERTRFTNYVASLWLEDLDHFGEIVAECPIAEAVSKLAEQQLWPPEYLRNHERISNWHMPDSQPHYWMLGFPLPRG